MSSSRIFWNCIIMSSSGIFFNCIIMSSSEIFWNYYYVKQWTFFKLYYYVKEWNFWASHSCTDAVFAVRQVSEIAVESTNLLLSCKGIWQLCIGLWIDWPAHCTNECISHHINGVGEAPTQLFPLESGNLNDCILSEDLTRIKSKKFSNSQLDIYRESCS
jgi:hypothetical protein